MGWSLLSEVVPRAKLRGEEPALLLAGAALCQVLLSCSTVMITFPFLCPVIDIPVSLDNLFQRIASVYDRFYLSRLNKLFEEN